jgi:tartrate dehydrogenase/decarboxylase/D-malate dehydrogenase
MDLSERGVMAVPDRSAASPVRARIAVIPGDGVGPEVVPEAIRVLTRVSDLEPLLSLSFDHFDWGSERYRRVGAMMPPDALRALSSYDAVLFGATGDPSVPDHITLRSLLIEIRFGFDLYVNLRPVRLLRGIASPLAGRTVSDIQMVFVREGTEGEYAGAGGRLHSGTVGEVAVQTSIFTRTGVERVVRWSFELARSEGKTLTSVSKGNALQYSGVLWDEVFDEVASDYPDVVTQRLLVDAAAMFMVRDPARFGVVVASNLFADILTDLGAALMGGMGMAPSANLDPTRKHPSMFEPVHGSAPDIAGKGVANPIGAIWSAGLMLEHLGFASWAARVVQAIERVVADDGVRTPDIGGSSSTVELGTAIADRLQLDAVENHAA